MSLIDNRLPSVPDPLIRPLRDPERLVRLVAQITKRSQEHVIARLRREEKFPGQTVQDDLNQKSIPPFVWSDALNQFYEETDAFLYESLVWNVTRRKNSLRRWIASFLLREFGAPVRILFFGDGLGFDSYYLAQAGHEVSSYEVSRYGTAFAESILTSDVNHAWTLVRDLDELPSSCFDAAICLDVLEHLPDPPAVVQRISETLRPGGFLIVHAPFFYIHPKVSTHLKANQRYSGDVRHLYHPAGLSVVDGRFFWDPIVLQKEDTSDVAIRCRYRSWLLYVSGCLLATGRYWSAPHAWIAQRLTRPRCVRLTEGMPAD